MLSETIVHLLNEYGYLIFFLAFSLGPFGIPVPNEVTIITGAILTNNGVLNPWVVYGLILAGLLTATTSGYWLGKFFGARILRWHRALSKAQTLFKKYGNVALFLGFLVPFVRYVVPVIAGISGVTYRKFAFISYSGAIVWTTVFFTIGKIFGDRIVDLLSIVNVKSVIIAILLLILCFTIKKLIRYVKLRKRIIREQ